MPVARTTETILSFILARTYLRPRDLIKFLKCCQKMPRKEKLSFSTVLAAEQLYSLWFHNEFRDEAQSFLPVWREALQCIARTNSKAVFNFIWLRTQFDNDPALSRWCHEEKKDVSEIINYLFDYGVIGTIDKAHRVSYKYMNPDASWQYEDIFFPPAGATIGIGYGVIDMTYPGGGPAFFEMASQNQLGTTGAPIPGFVP